MSLIVALHELEMVETMEWMLTWIEFEGVDVTVNLFEFFSQSGVSGEFVEVLVTSHTVLDAVVVEALQTKLASLFNHLLEDVEYHGAVVVVMQLLKTKNMENE